MDHCHIYVEKGPTAPKVCKQGNDSTETCPCEVVLFGMMCGDVCKKGFQNRTRCGRRRKNDSVKEEENLHTFK